jgi:hypothetical protein
VNERGPASIILCLFFLNDIVNNVNTDVIGKMNIGNFQLFLLIFADDAVISAHDRRIPTVNFKRHRRIWQCMGLRF